MCSVVGFYEHRQESETYKNVGHVFFQIFQLWRFRWFASLEINSPVPADQAQFPQFRVIELFAS